MIMIERPSAIIASTCRLLRRVSVLDDDSVILREADAIFLWLYERKLIHIYTVESHKGNGKWRTVVDWYLMLAPHSCRFTDFIPSSMHISQIVHLAMLVI